MKVTFIAREYPPYVYGGAGVHLRYLSEELSKFMEVEVRCFGDQNYKKNNLTVKGYNGWEKLSSKEFKFLPSLSTFATNLEIVAEKIDSEIVHTHTWYAAFCGFLAKNLYNTKFVLTCHSLEPLRPWKEDQLGPGYKLSSWVEKLGIESADAIVAVSNEMKKDILKFFNVSPEKIHVIHNGIDINVWKKTPMDEKLKSEYGIKDDYVLFVGRPTKQKGMEYLVEAADEIPVQIVMGAVGADTKEYEDEMKRKVAQKKNILWINKLLKEEEYVQLYSNAKVFICPSIYEPFGIINLEAMACETPVVASAVGGIIEVVVPNETGILIEPANPKAISQAVNELLKDEKKCKEMGKKGRERVENFFTWAHIAKQTKSLYEKLLS